MGIYWIISLSLTFVGLVEVMLSKNENTAQIRSYVYFVAVVVLFTFGGIRGLGTGLDDFQYRDFFVQFVDKIVIEGFWRTAEEFRYEPAIYAIAGITRVFTANPDIFIYVFTVIAVGINAWYFRKLTPLPIVALAVYSAHLFINKDMNQIRFGLCSAFLMGFVYHLSRRSKSGMITTFILSFISHATGIVALLIPLAMIVRKNKYIPILIVVASLPLAFMGSSALISLLSSHLGGLGDRAMGYANQESTQDQGILTLSNLKNIGFVFIFSFMLLSDRIRNFDATKFNTYYILVITFALGAGLRMALQDYASGGRLANFLLQVEPVLISLCIWETQKLKKVIAVGITVLMVLYYLYYNTVSSKQSITGYEVSQTFKLFR
ncbi:EpsG family protein [Pantoea rwandensis]|uniref:Amylovoran biosynthesis protein AmsC n=1 Tax=Pantoea rwandensis TaxID=1076550 RepID=A0A1X1D293_9GAMM|nr:EpsG family protein [Pantoea rwandensis]ORM70757.1 amylovoran biosynthesis protein AmsC [Pantoea rwandensis]